MGLDIVELVMDLEDEFAITISDGDSAKMRTPRDVAEFMLEHIPIEELKAQRCLTQKQFYRLRTILISEFNLPRAKIHPKTNLEQLFEQTPQMIWYKLKQIPDMPNLGSLVCSSSTCRLITIFLIMFYLVLWQVLSVDWLHTLGYTFVLWFALSATIIPGLANTIPEEYKTLGGLVHHVRLRDSLPDAILLDNQKLSLKEIDPLLYQHTIERVIRVTAMSAGIEEDKIHPDDAFVDDLGIC